MHYHLIMTSKCNMRCSYCYYKSMKEPDDALDGKFTFDFSASGSFSVPLEKLKTFISKDNNAVIIFYGGEPLMEIDKIKQIIDSIDVPFRMQTNGLLLDKLPIEYLKKISRILVSLDGDKERTDINRGKATYERIMNNIQLIRKKGYNGELVARMTISYPDLYEQVIHLLNIGFESIHWQLDAGFYKSDFDEKKFRMFVEQYNISVTKLVDYWLAQMRNGNVLKIYPFIGIIDSLLENEKTLLRCGAGHAGYAIGTDGKIYACPITNGIVDFVSGDIDGEPGELKIVDVSGDCLLCDIKDICGSRCLYWNKAKLWPKEGNGWICDTTRHLIGELQMALPEIERLIDQQILKKTDFEYEKYFGPEIIP